MNELISLGLAQVGAGQIMSTTVRRAGIYKLQLSHQSGNGLVFDFY